MTGFFITLEGIEGVGKSTQLLFVREYLEKMGRDVVVTREPGGTRVGETIRELVLDRQHTGMAADTELLLMFAARAEHLDKVIRPALRAGKVVLCDRFTDASYAYQGVGRNLTHDRIAVLEEWTQQGLKPDLTLLLDAPVATGLARAEKRSEKDRFESETLAFFEAVRNSYLDIARSEPERVKVIDASPALTDVQSNLTTILDHITSTWK